MTYCHGQSRLERAFYQVNWGQNLVIFSFAKIFKLEHLLIDNFILGSRFSITD